MFALYLLPLLLLIAAPARAGFKTPDCPDFKSTEFRYVKLITRQNDTSLEEPLKVAPAMRADGKVEVYFIERHGKVKRWNPDDNTVTTLAYLDTWTDSDDKKDTVGPAETGLDGIALDPDFQSNHRIYLRYEPWDKEVYRISRFEVKGDSLASEKVVLEIPYVREHTRLQPIVLGGAGLAFDPDGNLLINVGANSELSPSVNEKYRDFSAEYTSSNLRSLKGSILRIHPDDSPRGYSIPKGNFGEYWSDWFKEKGRDSLASLYADTAKVKAEVYIKGVRNPYTLTVDPVRGWVAWGEFGPNRMGVALIEEHNVATRPMYGGYPYWAGRQVFLLDGTKPWSEANMDPEAPINNSVWNEGPKDLPPADTAIYAYSAYLNSGFLVGNHPITGPLYHYDPNSSSSTKLPPHFDKALIVAERQTKNLRALQLDESGARVLDTTYIPTDYQMNRPLDLQQGPEGAIYVVDYHDGWHSTNFNANIGRVEYTGSCHPGVAVAVRKAGRGKPNVSIDRRRVDIREQGEHIVRRSDISGRVLGIWKGHGPHVYDTAVPSRQGLTLITVSFPGSGTYVSKVIATP